MALQVEFGFDDNSYRHTMNGHESVLHCHHYMTLTTKLAEDFADIGGIRVLIEVAEDTMRPLFTDYISQHGIGEPDQRLAVGKEYYSVMGLGVMEVTGNAAGGEVRLLRSHVDEGWLKKWGKHTKAINFFTRGYVAAVFGAAFDKPARSYEVTETASIVTGDDASILTVKLAQDGG